MAQSQTCRENVPPCCPQQQLKKRLSFSLSLVVVPSPSQMASVVPFSPMTTVEFFAFAYRYPRRLFPSHPNPLSSVLLKSPPGSIQSPVFGFSIYAFAAICANVMTVLMSVISGAFTVSNAHASGDDAHTPEYCRAAATMGSTTDGRRSFSLCICMGAVLTTKGLFSSCGVPSSDSIHNEEADWGTSCLRWAAGLLRLP